MKHLRTKVTYLDFILQYCPMSCYQDDTNHCNLLNSIKTTGLLSKVQVTQSNSYIQQFKLAFLPLHTYHDMHNPQHSNQCYSILNKLKLANTAALEWINFEIKI